VQGITTLRSGRTHTVLTRLWSARGFFGGLASIGLAFLGQQALVTLGDTDAAWRYYILAILLLLASLSHPSTELIRRVRGGHAGAGDADESAPAPDAASAPSPPTAHTGKLARLRARLGRQVIASGLALSFVLAAVSAYRLWHDTTDPIGGWLWAGALASLILSFVGAPAPSQPEQPEQPKGMPGPYSDFFARGVTTLAMHWETILVVGMLVLSLVLRLVNLEYMPGIFGDEGERGMDARAINEGGRVNIFGYGWWGVPNLYFYLVSIMLRIFGDTMIGDRMLSVISGVLAVWFVYKIGRLLWGPRAGLIAGILLAVSPLALQFSRLAGESTPTGTLWAGGFYFLFRALRYRRWSDWALAGALWGFSLYFYAAGKLIIPIAALAALYCLVRWARHGDFFKRYAPGWVLLGATFLLTFMPYAIFSFQDNWQGFMGRAAETSIFFPQNQAQAFERLAIPYDPSWANQPLVQNVLTHLWSWIQVLWGQMSLTLEVIYRTADPTPFYQIQEHGGSMLQPLWAAIALMGLAYAFWKVWDARYGLMSVWFWGGMLGAALTMDTPSVQRLIGAWPALMIFTAVLLDRVFASAWPLNLSLARKWALVPITALLVYFGADSYREYFLHYASLCPYCHDTAQARYAQALGQDYKGYQFGVDPNGPVFFSYGSTRFAAKGVEGEDMASPADFFPVTDNNGKGLAFMVYPGNSSYIPLIRLFYPTGDEQPALGADGSPQFISIKVSRDDLATYQSTHASYKQPSGVVRIRDERALGTLGANVNGVSGVAAWKAPLGLQFPVQASWQSGLVAPAYGAYTFYVTGSNTRLELDGRTILEGGSQVGGQGADAPQSVSVVLAKGMHDVKLSGSMDNALSRVELLWSGQGADPAVLDTRFLYAGSNGTTGGLSGELVAGYDETSFHSADPLGDKPRTQRRSDPFIGFREATTSFGGDPFTARWRGKLAISQAGQYAFDTISNGPSLVFIDGRIVVDNTSTANPGNPGSASGTVALAAGEHDVELRYAWQIGPARWEWFWTPPGGEHALVPTNVLLPAARSWLAAEFPDAPAAQLFTGDGSLTSSRTPDAVWGDGLGLSGPRGIGVDSQGNIYIGDRGNHRIVVVSPDGKIAATWGKAPDAGNEVNPSAGEFNDIVDVAVGINGNVYVMDTGAGQLQVFSPGGTLVRAIGREIVSASVADGIDVGPDGRFYIADPRSNSIKRLSPITGDSVVGPATDLTGAGQLDQPVDVAADPSNPGRIYVADLKDRIVQLDADGNITNQWSLPIGRDAGGSRIAVSPDGALVYVADPDRKRIDVLTVATGHIEYLNSTAYSGSGFSSPSGIAVGADGRLYVLDRGLNSVQVFPANK
jgi:sugar lactone lactonase YvrE